MTSIDADAQLELSVDTLQPNECFIVHLTTQVSWDDTRTDFVRRGDSRGGGWYPSNGDDDDEVIATRVDYRAQEENTKVVGIVTDEHTLAVLRKRAPEYELRVSEDMAQSNAHLKNFTAVSKYTFTKERHIVLTCTC